ncbi:MAG: hypothetical protein HY329_12470 [Chloroflexi bacterium]|nr:hypothetical protein [Chloroflexota bacterium]
MLRWAPDRIAFLASPENRQGWIEVGARRIIDRGRVSCRSELLFVTSWRNPLVLLIVLGLAAGLAWILGHYERQNRS